MWLKPHVVRKVRGLIVIHNDSIVFGWTSDVKRKFKSTSVRACEDLRMQKGLSQEALALACDLDRTYIGGVETGRKKYQPSKHPQNRGGIGRSSEGTVQCVRDLIFRKSFSAALRR
jgi:hypothetical protein